MPQNLRYALRRLVAEPGFALVVTLAIGLGIGMNTTVFTLVNAVLLRGLPYENSEDLLVAQGWNNESRNPAGVSWADFDEWRKETRVFTGLAAMAGMPMNVSGEPGAPERLVGARVTTNTFGVLGQPMALGRDFVQADGEPGAPKVIVLGYDVWERRFGGDRGVVGKTIRVNEVPHEIVGVMQRGVKFPNNNDAWVPLVPSDTERTNRKQRFVNVFGRIQHGRSVTEAQTELGAIAARQERDHPESNRNMGVDVMTFNEQQNGGPIRVVFLMLLASVSLLLLIACANVANLLIARAVARRREIGVRIALGASRRTILAQLLTESVVLGVLGGVLGLGLAYIGVTLFDRATADVGKPYWIVFNFDWKVFSWLALVCVGTGLVFGFAPAVQLARTDTNEVLKDAGRGSTSGRGRWLTSSLVVVEVAFTLALLGGAGVMIRSFMSMYGADLGAQTANVLTARVNLIEGKYPDAAARVRFVERLDERLRALPGVQHATIGTSLPGEGLGTLVVDLEGQPRASRENRRDARVGSVTHGYFETFGIRATQGRLLEPRDGQKGAEAVVVNQLFADRHFGGNAVGRRIMLRGDVDAADTVWATIVGVVTHVRHNDLTSNTLDAVVYRPFAMSTSNGFALALRSGIPPETLIATVRQTVQSIDQDLPVFQPRTMEENLARQRWPFRVFGTLFVLFAIFGLVLSTIGVYAVTAYSVGQRRNEIGLRMALGAQQSQIGWLVLRRGLTQLAIGLPIGLALAFGVMKVMEGSGDGQSLLVGFRAGDPLTMTAIALVVIAVTLIACMLPARRAARMNPVSALRN